MLSIFYLRMYVCMDMLYMYNGSIFRLSDDVMVSLAVNVAIVPRLIFNLYLRWLEGERGREREREREKFS